MTFFNNKIMVFVNNLKTLLEKLLMLPDKCNIQTVGHHDNPFAKFLC